ncbi:MAG TPA: hypothetical protein VFA04_15120 [Bryobacteraceae bacterium]|nr:hypothetical protein [Bryobacteraceae bacterium]
MKALISAAALFGALSSAQAQGIFPLMPPSVSTVASNGDGNPYGVVFAPKTLVPGLLLQPHDILVSNFNNGENLQGRGTTIVRIDRTGARSLFFASASTVTGMTAALGVLSNGCVLAGNLPTTDGTSATVGAGSISIVRDGGFFGSIRGSNVDGPWGMAVYDLGSGGAGSAHVFVSNVLNGTVVRFDVSYAGFSVSVTQQVVLASGLFHRADPAALELGPAGLAYDAAHDILYVANSADGTIYQIAHAASSTSTQPATPFLTDTAHLHGPLELAFLPNGHFVVANSDGTNIDPNQPSELVEYTAQGAFVNQMSIDPNNGAAFGLAIENIGWGTVRLAAVNDNANSVMIRTLVVQ